MLGSLKINTAVLICSAFLFRLLFVNTDILSSLSNHGTSYTKNRFSTASKSIGQFEISNKTTGNFEYSAVEICEEESGDSEQFKFSPFFIAQIFCSLIADDATTVLKKVTPSHNPLSSYSLQRYLAFQVFRV